MLAPPNVLNSRLDDEGQGRDGGCAGTVEQLIRAAHLLLASRGQHASPGKVSRLVRAYKRQVAPSGFPFAAYIISNLELAKAISYADPTGDTAVGNVLRAGGRDG